MHMVSLAGQDKWKYPDFVTGQATKYCRPINASILRPPAVRMRAILAESGAKVNTYCKNKVEIVCG